MIRCNESGPGLTINRLADQGKIASVRIVFPNHNIEDVVCNSAWAAVEFLRKEGFYTGPAQHIPHKITYE